MDRHLEYKGALGFPIRVGVLQHQEVLRLDRIGRFVLRHPSGAILGQVNPEDGVIEARARGAKPARLGWRLALAKHTDPQTAERDLPGRRRSARDLELELCEIGYEFGPADDPIKAREWWIVSAPFAGPEQADAARQAQPNPLLISLFEDRLAPPDGTVLLSIGGRAPLELPVFARLEPIEEPPHRVILHDVVVGVGFHWQHLENQKLRGALETRIDNRGLLTAVNELPLEEYLFSVNASEMMSQCPTALLEAQTIAARNTVLATMGTHHRADDFHLCADDHCQCYRGSSRETDKSRRAVLSTLGEVLVHGDRVCDCRYSKICGGIAEDSGSVWEGFAMPYMVPVWDGPVGSDEPAAFMPADTEERAKRFIDARPDVFCNTLTSVDVPQYLRYSGQYFRWTVEFTREDFEASLGRFPEYRVGELRDLQVISRGASGRIEYIRVVGAERSVVIGREYHIRKAFAPFFLYSSAFIPTLERDAAGRVTRVVLRGGGWGHGAGLCQIGAAMMGERGYSCGDILSHYYVGSRVARLFGRGADLGRILANERRWGDLRLGDRCYEYYNCYAAARCPVYKQGIPLRARAASADGKAIVRFRQDSAERRKAADIEALGVDCCEFLDFDGPVATPKTGVD